MNQPVLTIREAQLPADAQAIEQLWLDYLTWGNAQMRAHFGVQPHIPAQQVGQDMADMGKFLPPHGRLLLAFVDNTPCGIGCLKCINTDIAEVKRMYVDPAFRKIGAGRAILQSLLHAAKEVGYQKVRLDSPRFMEPAHALYRSMGFAEIPPYAEAEIPAAFRAYMLFMEMELAPKASK